MAVKGAGSKGSNNVTTNLLNSVLAQENGTAYVIEDFRYSENSEREGRSGGLLRRDAKKPSLAGIVSDSADSADVKH